MNPDMDKIAVSMYDIGETLKRGRFTRGELSDLRMLLQGILGVIDRILKRADNKDPDVDDSSG